MNRHVKLVTHSVCSGLPLFVLGLGLSAVAQNTLPEPKVGGDGTFANAPGRNGAGDTGVRRRLSPVGAAPEDLTRLKLSPGFLIAMEVYDTPEFSTELRVDQSGNVSVPTLAPIHVGGLTLVEASTTIATALKDQKILVDPQVNLNIEEYPASETTVLGEVRNPGRIELLAPRRLDEVIAMAGGSTEYAGSVVSIKRREANGGTQAFIVKFSRDPKNTTLNETFVEPGDTVDVERAGLVYVLGGVARPGGYVMQEGGKLDVTQAIALAYGTTMPAAVESIRLIRKGDDGKVTEIPVHYRDIVKGKSPSIPLQAEDVVYVPISKVKTILTSGLVATGVAAAVIYGH
jgi:polysaccharide biosynthesis/export protein